MSYDPNIPLGGNDMSVSQGQLNTNFTQLNTIFGVDHAAFDAVSNNGKHEKVTFPKQTTAPESSGSDIVVYAAEDAVTNATELYADRNGTAFQLTRNDLLFMGMHPHCAVNFTPGAGTGGTAGGGTLNSQYNLTDVDRTASGRYTIQFPQLKDEAGNGTSNYMWQLGCVAPDANLTDPVTVTALQDSTYGDVATDTSLKIVCRSNSGSYVDPTRVIAVIWKVQ